MWLKPSASVHSDAILVVGKHGEASPSQCTLLVPEPCALGPYVVKPVQAPVPQCSSVLEPCMDVGAKNACLAVVTTLASSTSQKPR
eukprot:c41528_g1_i1 orf=327-584(-)